MDTPDKTFDIIPNPEGTKRAPWHGQKPRTFAVYAPGGQMFPGMGSLCWTKDNKDGTKLWLGVHGETHALRLDPRDLVIEVEHDADKCVKGVVAYHPRRDGIFVGAYADWMRDHPSWPQSVLNEIVGEVVDDTGSE